MNVKQSYLILVIKRLFVGIVIVLMLSMVMSCGRHRNYRNTSTISRITTERTSRRNTTTHHGGRTSIKMRLSNGVYYVPCMINGTNMEFIFDTGASDIIMSLTEALFLIKQGKLSEEDIVDEVMFQTADGSIGEGTVVNLETVTIGSKTLHNVRATIISNMEAPLLLGQSALSRFGRLSIDYKRNEITFE